MAVTPEKGLEAHLAVPVRLKAQKTLNKWHHIYGHMDPQSILLLKVKNMVTGLEIDMSELVRSQCKTCVKAKQHVKIFPKKSLMKVKEVGNMTVTNIWGPARTAAIGGQLYYVSYTDVKGRRIVTYPMQHKSEALMKFKAYRVIMKTHFDVDLKTLHTDNGGEYIGKEFKAYLTKHEITLKTTAPDLPAQNGIAECLNRMLVEHARAMLHTHNLLKKLWKEAVQYTCYLKNHSLTCALRDKTPEEVITGKKPDVVNLQEFGIKCWVLIDKQKQIKLDLKSKPIIFTGIVKGSKVWHYYNPRTGTIGKLRNLIFEVEGEPDNGKDLDLVESAPTRLEGENGKNESAMEQVELSKKITGLETPKMGTPIWEPIASTRTSSRLAEKPRLDHKQLHFGAPSRPPKAAVEEILNEESHHLCMHNLTGTEVLLELHSYKEACASDYWPQWKKAMDKEMEQLGRLGTYKLWDMPEDQKKISSKWIYRLK